MIDGSPLSNRKLLVTRASHQAPEMSSLIRERGGVPVEFPVIRIASPDSWEPVDRAIQQLSTFDWLVFTSRNGVDQFFERMNTVQSAEGQGAIPPIAAIGPKTAEAVRTHGSDVELQPSEYRAEQLASELNNTLSPSSSLLVARSNVARPVLTDELSKQGHTITEVHPYHLKRNDQHDDNTLTYLRNTSLDLLTFASSRTVSNFMEIIEMQELSHLRQVPAACIGPITAGTAREAGLEIVAVPDDYTVEHLVNCASTYFHNTVPS